MKLRTTIMVASMIALPLAAVIGFRWPRFSAAEKTSSLASSRSVDSTKPAGPSAPTWNATAVPAAKPSATPNVATVVPAGGFNAADNPGSQVIQASNNDVRGYNSGGNLFVSDPGAVGQIVLDEPDSNIHPPPTPTEPNETTDPFLQIQQRLKALGALHYSLETWGPQGEAYKFQCRMAAGHNPNYSRHFEATDVDPVRVMQTVLNDVEAWKSGRLP